jgi:hypothetical protein
MKEPPELAIIDAAIDGKWNDILLMMEAGKNQKGVYEQIEDINSKLNVGINIPNVEISVTQYSLEKEEKPKKGSEFDYTGWRLVQVYRPTQKETWGKERTFGAEKVSENEGWHYEAEVSK